MDASTEAAGRRQYLAFTVARGDYAIGILKVKEILQYEEITAVPSTPPSIRGVLNLRGAVVPVVDLAVKFGLPATAVTKRTCVLVAETAFDGASTVVGLVADAVREVIELTPADIEEAPGFGTGVRIEFLVGMGKVGKRFVLLLDIDRLLAADEQALAAALVTGEVAPSEDGGATGASLPDVAAPAADAQAG